MQRPRIAQSIIRSHGRIGHAPHQIQAVPGHKTLSEVTKYTEKANRKKLADAGVEGLTKDKQ